MKHLGHTKNYRIIKKLSQRIIGNHMTISWIKLIIASCLSFSTFSSTNVYESIARINRAALPDEPEKKRDALNDLMSESKQFHEVVYDNLNEQLNPSPAQKRQTIFSFLSSYEKNHKLPTGTCLDQTTWRDLELLCGSSKTNPSLYLAQQLDRTTTGMGQAVLYRTLVQPRTNYQDLVNQQIIIKELVTNQKLFDELDTKIKEIAMHENAFILD